MRFYELDGGAITLDGVDIAQMRARRCAPNIGHGAPGHLALRRHHPREHRVRPPDATEAEIVKAAEAAHVDRFVHPLPDGYDTVLDDDASNISPGEKQLLTIARAFLTDPPILILDEATSSVDTRTEVLIQKAMAALMQGPHELRHRAPALDDPRRRPRSSS